MKKKAIVSQKFLEKVFTVPEKPGSTLFEIEKQISHNISGFLSENTVASDLIPEKIEKLFGDFNMPEQPTFVSDHAKFIFKNLLKQSIHVSSPTFIGHMTSSLPYFMLPLAKIMIALNQNLVKIETSKAFTPLERQVIGILHKTFYQKNDRFYHDNMQNAEKALGLMCSGGTIANLSGLWLARNQLLAPSIKGKKSFSGIGKAGLVKALNFYGYKDIVCLVSEKAHYSLSKSCDVLGIGKDNIIRIKTDSNHQMECDDLEKQITLHKKQGNAILAVVAVAGTTEIGAIDPLDDIAKICKREKIHMHVDAAWGGPIIFSDELRHLMAGIEKSDTITIDAHKQLYTPFGAGLLLIKKPTLAKAIQSEAAYIIRKGSRDLGKYTLEGSRPGMALLIHSALSIFGRLGFEKLLNYNVEKAKDFAFMIKENPRFELINEPQLNLLCYRYIPEKVNFKLNQYIQKEEWQKVRALNRKVNELTIAIQKKQRSKGKSFVSRTSFASPLYKDQTIVVFRAVIANPLTKIEHLKQVLLEQNQIGTKLAKKFFS